MNSGIFGLVLAGGESRRMGSSKAGLDYWGKAQQYHVYEMLAPFCDRVFISCRKALAAELQQGYEVLADNETLGEIGPMNALITAFEYHACPWLVMGCDYPLFDREEIQNLLGSRDPAAIATAILNPGLQKPEPLLAIYEPAAFEWLLQAFHKGEHSLRKVLLSHPCKTIAPLDDASIQSVDTPEQFLEIRKKIRS